MPSVTLHRQGVQPVEAHEVVEAVAALLAADDALCAHLGAGDVATGRARIHAHEVSLRDASGAEASGAPLWLLVREMGQIGARGSEDRPSGLVTVRLQVQVNAAPPSEGGPASPVSAIGYAHTLAWAALQGAQVDVTRGAGRAVSTGQITRTDLPSPTRRDTGADGSGGSGRFYSSAYWSAPMRPAAP